MIRVAVLPGDGIGPEVLEGPVAVLRSLAGAGLLQVTGPWPVGASAFAEAAQGLPEATLDACEAADAIFLGAVGEQPGVALEDYRPELALIGLREHFDLRVSVRRVARRGLPPLTIVRNLLGGAYGDTTTRPRAPARGRPRRGRAHRDADRGAGQIACDELERAVWRRLGVGGQGQPLRDQSAVAPRGRPGRRERGIRVRHVYVDRSAFELAHGDDVGDVLLTEGIFGDILSDVAAGRAGSIALCSSASVRPGPPRRGRCQWLFEPVHGSAPRHAGAGRANPSGAYLALADAPRVVRRRRRPSAGPSVARSNAPSRTGRSPTTWHRLARRSPPPGSWRPRINAELEVLVP